MTTIAQLPSAPVPRAAVAPRLLRAAVAMPEHCYTQAELSDVLQGWLHDRPALAEKARAILAHAGVERRYTVRPAEWYLTHTSVAERTAVYCTEMVRLCEAAVVAVLEASGVAAEEVGLIVSTSCTGIMIPSVDSHLMNRLPFRPTTRRQPLTELGCVAGAAALSQATDYLRAHPTQAAVVVSGELASLTAQVQDFSLTNVVAGALFGDGAGAAVLVGEDYVPAPGAAGGSAADGGNGGLPAARVVATRSVLFPDTLDMMGFDNTDSGLRIFLSPRVPRFLGRRVPPELDAFLAEQGLAREDLRHLLLHPGGRKVMDALEAALALTPAQTALSRRALREFGNLSSATVLAILHLFAQETRPAPGDFGLLMAVGPGFCAELVLLRW